ncbi:hypothetical protein LTR70_003816 [Exophiala xenobiotica]|uniref:Uncharacterized protein n=1 Tax=Lithohypha guttulata TaxID=1690604 RepID=A0ABR0KFI4_9EURO|nr:hypothetical protein LTR24_003317 [Lithohypha guttulata]KAK5322314.1 hypothetical protein LTR70_003816 [Exophiala xenobiotica]
MSDPEETERKWKAKRAQDRAEKRRRQHEDTPNDNLERQKLDAVEETLKSPEDELNQLRKEVEEKEADNARKWQEVNVLRELTLGRIAEATKLRNLMMSFECNDKLELRHIGQRAQAFQSLATSFTGQLLSDLGHPQSDEWQTPDPMQPMVQAIRDSCKEKVTLLLGDRSEANGREDGEDSDSDLVKKELDEIKARLTSLKKRVETHRHSD